MPHRELLEALQIRRQTPRQLIVTPDYAGVSNGYDDRNLHVRKFSHTLRSQTAIGALM